MPTCGRSCARPGCTTRPCWPGWPPTAPTLEETGYGRCGILSIGLRESEDEWFAPFAEVVQRRSPGDVVEITPEEASSLFPPLGPVHRVLHAPASARGRRARHGGRAAAGGGGTWRGLRDGCGARRGGGRGRHAPRRGGRGRGASERGVRRRRRGRWRLDRRGGRMARRAAAGRPHQGADRAPRRRGGDGGVAHRAAAAHPLSRALARRAGWPAAARSRPRPGSPSA